jgi:putative membrane protein
MSKKNKQNHGKAVSHNSKKEEAQIGSGSPSLQNEAPSIWKRVPRLFGVGMGMGTADLIPGVSGGTVAFIFGIYQELLKSIKVSTGEALHALIKGDIKKAFAVVPFGFLIPVAAGIFTAILLLSQILSWMLKEYPAQVWGFFFGLVLVSILIISQRVSQWQARHAIGFILAGIATYFIVGAVPVETPATLPMFFFSGMIAISAMILPGISGSFILLILGKYSQILEAVNNRDFLVLAVFMLGCVIGIALFSRVLTWLFARYHDIAVAILAGVMFGSLRKLWPWKEVTMTRINSHGEVVPLAEVNVFPAEINSGVVTAVILAVVGAVMMYYLNSLQLVKEKRIEK